MKDCWNGFWNIKIKLYYFLNTGTNENFCSGIFYKNQFFARKIVVLSVLKDEIRTAGRLAHDAYYEKGYDAGRKIADDLIGRMVLDGSNTPENISVFEDATGYSYK